MKLFHSISKVCSLMTLYSVTLEEGREGGGGGHNPISHQKFFQNPSPSWIFIKNIWLCVLHVAEVVSYLHGYLT